jgi:hypothetical protein
MLFRQPDRREALQTDFGTGAEAGKPTVQRVSLARDNALLSKTLTALLVLVTPAERN